MEKKRNRLFYPTFLNPQISSPTSPNLPNAQNTLCFTSVLAGNGTGTLITFPGLFIGTGTGTAWYTGGLGRTTGTYLVMKKKIQKSGMKPGWKQLRRYLHERTK